MYKTPAKTAVTNEAITATMLEFIAKAMDHENEYLQYYTIYLIDNLESLQSLYLTKYNLISITPDIRSPEQARIMSKQFNNLPSARQVQMIYAILNEEEIRLHTMIRAMLKQIDTISQERKSLQVWKEKLKRVFQMITKVLQDLKAKENMVRQAKSNIENLDRRITEAQNPPIRLPDVSHITSAAIARSVAATV